MTGPTRGVAGGAFVSAWLERLAADAAGAAPRRDALDPWTSIGGG